MSDCKLLTSQAEGGRFAGISIGDGVHEASVVRVVGRTARSPLATRLWVNGVLENPVVASS